MSWANQYVQVPSGLAEKIRKMKEEEDAIPVYEPNLIEVGDLEFQSKYELMLKLKNNLEEIEKYNKNGEAKGRIATIGYACFSLKEKYVFPIFDHIFNLDELSKSVNGLIEKVCNEKWDDIESKQNHDYLSKRNYPIHHYIHFIRDKRQQIMWAIRNCSDLKKLQLTISIDWWDLNTIFDKKIEKTDKEYFIPVKVNFLISYDDKIILYKCGSCSSDGESFENPLQLSSYWVKNKKNVDRYKLSEWDKALKNPNTVIVTDSFQGKANN